MRRDNAHPLARIVVDRPVVFVAGNAEEASARDRSIEHAAHEIDEPLRLRPLLIETGIQIFTVGDDVANADRVFDLGEDVAPRDRIETDIFLEIEARILGIEAKP